MRVYLSGPISSSGTFLTNAAYAIEVYEHLLKMGYNPMCPQLTVFAFIGRHDTVTHEEWMRCDEAWIRSMDPETDVLLRLHGRSKGADMEVGFANDMGMTVVYGEAPAWGFGPYDVACQFDDFCKRRSE